MKCQDVTVVEVMVVLAIFWIISTMSYSAMSTTSRHKQHVEEDLDRHHMLAAALERMARELSMAYVSAHRNPNESLNVMETEFHGQDHGQRDRIVFASFGHVRLYRNADESDQNEISYFMAHHPDDSSRMGL